MVWPFKKPHYPAQGETKLVTGKDGGLVYLVAMDSECYAECRQIIEKHTTVQAALDAIIAIDDFYDNVAVATQVPRRFFPKTKEQTNGSN